MALLDQLETIAAGYPDLVWCLLDAKAAGPGPVHYPWWLVVAGQPTSVCSFCDDILPRCRAELLAQVDPQSGLFEWRDVLHEDEGGWCREPFPMLRGAWNLPRRPTRGRLEAKFRQTQKRLDRSREGRRATVQRWLYEDLVETFEELMAPLEPSETMADRIADLTTGSAELPGVYRPGCDVSDCQDLRPKAWVAWAHDPCGTDMWADEVAVSAGWPPFDPAVLFGPIGKEFGRIMVRGDATMLPAVAPPTVAWQLDLFMPPPSGPRYGSADGPDCDDIPF